MHRGKLVIIDPQNDFTHVRGFYGQRHGLQHISEAKGKINDMLPSVNKADVMVICSDYGPNQFGEGLQLCIPDTFGHQIDPDLDLDDTMTWMTKTEHSCFSSEVFRNYLKAFDVTTLFICGFLAEYCIKQSAIDALEAGFQVYLVEDAIATGDDVQERKMQMLKDLVWKGAKITQTNEGWQPPCRHSSK
jgi:nicotinamidase/pyrazinamidase